MKRILEFNFAATLLSYGLKITPLSVDTMQVNITKQCNQSCAHCHVDASPKRTERMERRVIERCLEILAANNEITVLDITGGAPELHPEFRQFVRGARKLGKKVMVRHNLTVMFDARVGNDLSDFFAVNQVELIASLPHYQKYLTDKQRGSGVFNKSISALKLLNEVGYGKEGSGLILNLVYNPRGAFLPANQSSLEQDFRRELFSCYGIVFDSLYTVTNMPINRFKAELEKSGACDDYMNRLKGAFKSKAAENVMCRRQMSIGYDGRAYDCDFNQMLGLQVVTEQPVDVFNFDLRDFLSRRIVFGAHCYGCTAGSGSS